MAIGTMKIMASSEIHESFSAMLSPARLEAGYDAALWPFLGPLLADAVLAEALLADALPDSALVGFFAAFAIEATPLSSRAAAR
jgi:hypothetical protein